MSELATTGMRRTVGTATWVRLLIAIGIVTVVAANAHLVYVATTSQPDCVTHLRQGEVSHQPGLFSAAQSTCSPPLVAPAGHSSERYPP